MLFKQLLKPLRLSLTKEHSRSASIVSALNTSPVLVSSNQDIYTNLALEHWLYTNLRFNQDDSDSRDNQQASRTFKQPVVLIWTDEPCVVIGRHQNPWIETTLGLVNRLGIKLARRHSGGGCVYHDPNNINISIIGDRRVFDDRQANLRFLANILNEKYGIACEPNKRHDLIHSTTGRKMSGSAAKLGRFNSYHHFTLLVDTDVEIMQAVIRQKQQEFINTNSSMSTRSSVINLSELESKLTVQQVISDLSQAYGRHYKTSGSETAEVKETKVEGERAEFESLTKYRDDLTSWKWLYGMTPKFKLRRHIKLMESGAMRDVQFSIEINRGVFEKFAIECDSSKIRELADKFNHLVGTNFDYKEAMVNVVKMLQVDDSTASGSCSVTSGEQIFATYLLQMIHESNFDSLQERPTDSEQATKDC